MKFLKKIFFTKLLIFSFLLLQGCSHLNSDNGTHVIPFFSNSSGESDTVQVKVTTPDSSIDFSRSIMPSRINASTLTYYIAQSKLNSSEKKYTISTLNLTSSDSNTGYFSLKLSSETYFIVIYALTPEQVLTARKEGYTSKNFTLQTLDKYAGFTGNSTIAPGIKNPHIFMKANDYSSARAGGFSIQLSHANSWKVPEDYTVTAGLYSLETGLLVYPENGHEKILVSRAQFEQSFGEKKVESEPTIKPGNYNFVINYNHFDSGLYDSEPDKVFTYSERLILLANRTSEAVIEIPALIEAKPEAPKCFIAGYVPPANDNYGFYGVQFAWYDNSAIETGFKIQIIEMADEVTASMPSNDAEFDVLAKMQGAYEFTTEKNIGMNDVSKVVYLPLGKRYIARICATNISGDSPFAYLNKTLSHTFTDPLDAEKTATLEADYNLFGNDVDSVNLYRISYFPQYGSFKAKKGDADAAIPSVVIYESQHSTGGKVKLLTPDGISLNSYKSVASSVNNAKLSLFFEHSGKSIFWKNWAVNSEEGDAYPYTEKFEVNSEPFNQLLRYYADDEGNFASPQPDSTSYAPGVFYTRTVTQDSYEGFKNLTLVAVFDEKITNTYQQYNLLSEYISPLFLKNGGWTHFYDEGLELTDTDGDGTITLADIPSRNYLTLTKNSGTQISFYIPPSIQSLQNGEMFSYDNVVLEITDSLTSQSLGSIGIVSNDIYVPLSILPKSGNYNFVFKAKMNSIPDIVFTNIMVLNYFK